MNREQLQATLPVFISEKIFLNLFGLQLVDMVGLFLLFIA